MTDELTHHTPSEEFRCLVVGIARTAVGADQHDCPASVLVHAPPRSRRYGTGRVVVTEHKGTLPSYWTVL